MTDPHRPDPAPDDDVLEVASAYLDDAATPEEIALVESDEDLRRLVAALAAVGGRLPVGDPPPELTDRHVTTALAEFDAAGPSSGATVADLAAARSRRSWLERIPLGAVAAAALLIALIGGISLLEFGADDADTATSADSETLDATAGSAGDAAEGFDDGEFDGEGSDEDAPTSAAADRARLAFADNDALADHVTRELTATAAPDASADEQSEATAGAATAEEEGSFAGCDPVEASGVRDAPIITVIPAVVAGREVTGIVVDEGVRRLVVVDEATCAVVDDRELSD